MPTPPQPTTSRAPRWRGILRAPAGVAAVAATSVAMLYLYGSLSKHWSDVGGTHSRFFRLEVPLFVFAVWLCHVPCPPRSTIARRVVGLLISCLPAWLVLILLDGGLAYLHRCLCPSDLGLLPSLYAAVPELALAVTAVLAAITAIPLARAALRARAEAWRWWPRWLLPRFGVAAIFWLGLHGVVPGIRGYVLDNVEYLSYSEPETMRKNGRLATVAYLTTLRAEALERLRRTWPAAPAAERLDRGITATRNLYLVVLESFVDPRLLTGVEFDRSPLHPKLAALLGGEGAFDTITAPVYGGHTAQTEFELLTGLPALARVKGIDFNALEGGAVPSLVRALAQRGYTTVASIAASGIYYNGRRAYRSLGFDAVHFLDDDDNYLARARQGRHLFDGDLFDANLDYLRAEVIPKGRPFVNYVVGMYGHHPYERDRAARPDHCRALPDGDGTSTVERVANQFYHRTGALADLLTEIRRRDPTAIVFVTSDHLPPLLDGRIGYRYEPSRNICLLFDGDQPVRLDGAPVFHVAYRILERLGGQPVPVPDRETLEREYLATMAIGLGIEPR